jgi:hypothetical protein
VCSSGWRLGPDWACSLHLRGKEDAGRGLHETITLEEKIGRTAANLDAFLRQVLAE